MYIAPTVGTVGITVVWCSGMQCCMKQKFVDTCAMTLDIALPHVSLFSSSLELPVRVDATGCL